MNFVTLLQKSILNVRAAKLKLRLDVLAKCVQGGQVRRRVARYRYRHLGQEYLQLVQYAKERGLR